MQKKTKYNLCIFLGIVLMLCSLLWTLYNFYEDYQMFLNAQRVTALLEPKMLESFEQDFDLLSTDAEMPSQEIDGYAYIGILEIPSLALKLPIMDRWDQERLKISPTYYSGSYHLDNLVLCAHNSQAHFGKVNQIKLGDEIVFTSVDDKVIKYVVTNLRVLKETDVEEMITNQDANSAKEDWDLTLFTCTLDGKARFAVRAVRVH